MRSRLRSFAALATLATLATLPACAGDLADPTGDPVAELAANDFTLSGAAGDDAIVVADQGTWSQVLACSGICVVREAFWVDLSVRNDAFDKEVAIVWSSDDWQTSHLAPASFEHALADGREQWGVDVELGAFSPFNPRPPEVAYAVFVRMAGQTHWDRFNDHYVYQPVDAAHPVRLLHSQVRYQAATGAELTGTLRVYDLGFQKQVSVRYSTDDWQSWREVDARWVHDDDWAFTAGDLGRDVLPAHVDFAVHYRVAGQDLWDSNGGANFEHVLAPQIAISAPVGLADAAGAVSGIVNASTAVTTDLPIADTQIRLDGGAWHGDPAFPGNGQSLQFSTADLADGAHTIGARVELAGGFTASGEDGFTVHNVLRPAGVWHPSLPGQTADARGVTWGAALATDGHVYVQWEPSTAFDQPIVHTVTRFDAYGQTGAPLEYEPLPAGDGGFPPSVWDFAVDDAGRLYGYSNFFPGVTLWRWDADGHLDASFGVLGRLDATTALVGFDVARALATGGGSVWLVGTCPGWDASCAPGVVRLAADGTPLGHVDLPDDQLFPDRPFPLDPGAATYSDGALWVLRGGTIARIAVDDATGALAVTDVIPLGAEIDPQSLARSADGHFWVLSFQGIFAFDVDGTLAATWTVGGSAALAGGTELARVLLALPDGSVALLDVSGTSLTRFVAPWSVQASPSVSSAR